MTDVHSREARRANMAAVRSRDTKPELIVRRAVHGMGLRFRLHRPNLPGSPDLVLPRHRKVIAFMAVSGISMIAVPAGPSQRRVLGSGKRSETPMSLGISALSRV
jgi:hypothetical protein